MKRDEELTKQEEDTIQHTAIDLIQRMKQALEDDRKSYNNGEPAVAKMSMLDEVANKASKPILQYALIANDFLDVLNEWLTPLSSSLVLPDINLRTVILKILLELPIKGEPSKLPMIKEGLMEQGMEPGIEVVHLKSSKIGHWVRILSSHAKETPENRMRANRIMDRWSRLIYGLSDKYKEASMQPQLVPPPPPLSSPQQQRRKVRSSSSQHKKQQEVEEERPSKRARVPRLDGHDFTLRPRSNINIAEKKESKNESETVQKRLSRKLADLKRKK